MEESSGRRMKVDGGAHEETPFLSEDAVSPGSTDAVSPGSTDATSSEDTGVSDSSTVQKKNSCLDYVRAEDNPNRLKNDFYLVDLPECRTTQNKPLAVYCHMTPSNTLEGGWTLVLSTANDNIGGVTFIQDMKSPSDVYAPSPERPGYVKPACLQGLLATASQVQI